MAYKVLLGRAPSYLGPLVRVVDVSGRRALRSAGTNRILVPPVTSTTVGSRALSVAAPLIWNSLPDDVISAESLPTFQRKLKRRTSVLSIVSWLLLLTFTPAVDLAVAVSLRPLLKYFDWLIEMVANVKIAFTECWYGSKTVQTIKYGHVNNRLNK